MNVERKRSPNNNKAHTFQEQEANVVLGIATVYAYKACVYGINRTFSEKARCETKIKINKVS